ncbi:MAG: hypothetical protein H7833_10515 [Magnetococcus sp. DMHC-1]
MSNPFFEGVLNGCRIAGRGLPDSRAEIIRVGQGDALPGLDDDKQTLLDGKAVGFLKSVLIFRDSELMNLIFG